jgi:hypothetical protein
MALFGYIIGSRHLLGPRPPPTDRSSPDLSLYGGKTAIAVARCPYTLEKEPETLFTRSRTPHYSKPITRATRLQNGKPATLLDSSPAHLPFGGGTVAIEGCTRRHAPARLRPLSPRASTQQHLQGTRGHAPGTHPCHASPLCVATSAGKKNLGRRNGLLYSPNSSSRHL